MTSANVELGLLRKRISELETQVADLQARNEYLRKLYEQAPLGYQSLDENGNFLEVNQAWLDVFGYCREEVLGRNFSEFLHPDWREHFRENFPRFKAVGEVLGVEFEMQRKDGSLLLVSFHGKIGRDSLGSFQQTHCIFQDLTERRQAEEAVWARERYLRTILQTSPDGFWVLDDTGKVVEVNEAYCAMSGYGRGEILGMSISDLDADETPAETAARMARIIAAGSELFETRHRRKDGTLFPVEVSTAWVDEDGGRFVCFGRDLTERRLAEKKIRTSYMTLETIMNSIEASIYVADMQTHELLFVNAYGRKILGEDVVGQQCWQVLQRQDGPCSFCTNDKLLTVDGKSAGIYQWVFQNTVNQRWYEINDCAIRWPDGRMVRMEVAVDMTSRKQVEEELRRRENQLQRIFEILPIGLWFADKNGTLLRGNPKGVEIWGAEPTVPLSEYGVFKAWHLPSRKPVEADQWALVKTIRNGETIVDELLEIESFDGKRKTILNYTAPLLDDNGQVDGAIIVNLDISDRVALEDQLLQAQKMESIGRLAGGVAHDFNNMLGVILGYSEMLLEQVPAGQPMYKAVRGIQQAAQRSAALTRQLLTFARKQTVAPRVLDLNETVAGMLTMLRRLIGEDIDLAWLPGQDLGPIMMDPSQIDQILANLCVNARDAIGGNTGKVTIETANAFFDQSYCAVHAGYVPGNYVLLAVSDDGCGMDSETYSHLFEPFFTTKEMGKGTGLGLAMVYGIIRQNNGFINVYSEPGQGTTFKMYLPRCAATGEASSGTAAAIQSLSGQETILLVEDEPMILEMVSAMLQQQGYTVLAAATPGEAIHLAREYATEIHLLMTDVVMPEMNGRELAGNLLTLYPALKHLFMSGYTANVIAHHGVLDAGVHFIQKPFSINELAAKVRKALTAEVEK